MQPSLTSVGMIQQRPVQRQSLPTSATTESRQVSEELVHCFDVKHRSPLKLYSE